MFPDVQALLLSVMLEVEVKNSHFHLIMAFFNVISNLFVYHNLFKCLLFIHRFSSTYWFSCSEYFLHKTFRHFRFYDCKA